MKSLFFATLLVCATCARAQAPAVPLGTWLAARPLSMATSPEAATATPKSKAVALLYSVLVPGMGELYAGAWNTGRYFTASEVMLWLGYAGMALYGHSLSTDAHTYAAAHAGARTAGKDDAFFTNVGNFTNEEQYNDKKARDGDYALIYTQAGYGWRWDSEDNRSYYRALNVRANTIVDNTKYVAAAIVVNHLASAIDAILQVNRVNAALKLGAVPTFENGIAGTRIELQVGM